MLMVIPFVMGQVAFYNKTFSVLSFSLSHSVSICVSVSLSLCLSWSLSLSFLLCLSLSVLPLSLSFLLETFASLFERLWECCVAQEVQYLFFPPSPRSQSSGWSSAASSRSESCSPSLTWPTRVLPAVTSTRMLSLCGSSSRMDTKWHWHSLLLRTWASTVSTA